MENRLSYIVIGAFVFSLLIGSVFAILWLGNYSDKGSFKYYKVATKESVSGLNDKAPVKLRGVQIGEVRSITINPNNAEEVLITIRVQDNAPIKEDTYAVLEAQGITGLSFVQLQGGSNDAKDLKTSAKPEEYGIINSGPSTFSRLDKTITSVSAKAEMIFERADALMSEKNLKNIETIIENSAKISESTQKTLANLEARNKEINQILQEAVHLEKSAIEAVNSIKTAVDTSGVEALNNVKEASQSVKNAMNGINAKLEKGAFDIDILVKDNFIPLQQSLLEMRVLMNETKDLVSNLKDSPSDLLFKEVTLNPAPNERR